MKTRPATIPEPTKSIEEATKSFLDALKKYASSEGLVAVGYCDDPSDINGVHIVVYTVTKRRANNIIAFMGYWWEGYRVIGRAIGRVTLCSRG